jgi:signal peptidase I
MYVCFTVAVLNGLVLLATGQRLDAILTVCFYLFAAFGIRSFSWTASLSALGIYGVGLIISTFTLGLFVGVVGFIFFGLLIGGVRAVSFASRWKVDHPGEDIRNEPLDGLSASQRFFARLPVAFWPWARPFFVAYLALYALLIIVLINSGVFVRVLRTNSEGMQPGIMRGEQVIALKQWVMGPVQRGDVVIFRTPRPRSMFDVKRVIGIPGDRLHFHDRKLILNGDTVAEPYAVHAPGFVDEYGDNFPTRFSDLPYSDAINALKKNVQNGELIVAPGFYFVLGDNRDFSFDSRYIGLIPADDITGRVIFVSAPDRGFRVVSRIRIP